VDDTKALPRWDLLNDKARLSGPGLDQALVQSRW
jgi:hypothetical protein